MTCSCRRLTSALVLLAVVAVSCTGDGDVSSPDGGGGSVSTPAAPTETTETATAESVATSDTPSTEATSMPSTTPTPPAETIVPIPDVGVPGIDSDDPFCRAWSEFAGSFQALAFASTVRDVSAAARLELVASAAVSSSAQVIADEFPASIGVERGVFVDDVIGPFARRAGRASGALGAAGLSPAQIDSLGDLWLRALVGAGVDDAEIDVAVPDELVDAVAVAVDRFSTDVPVIAEDPSLVTQASAPATFEYLSMNCPDQGILAGNDAID